MDFRQDLRSFFQYKSSEKKPKTADEESALTEAQAPPAFMRSKKSLVKKSEPKPAAVKVWLAEWHI